MEAGKNPVAKCPGQRLGLPEVGAQVRQEYVEVVPAHTGHRVGVGDGFGQARGDLP